MRSPLTAFRDVGRIFEIEAKDRHLVVHTQADRCRVHDVETSVENFDVC
jgi:hypothetical protein